MQERDSTISARKKKINVNDRRVKKTNKALRETLIALLEKKPLNEITVKELAEAADINRSTFYFYYEDIYDMVDQLQNEIYDVFVETVVKPKNSMTSLEEYFEYIERFFNFCKDNTAQCEFVLNNDINNKLIDRIKAVVRENVPDSVKAYPLPSPLYYLTTFAISAITGVVVQWLADGMPTDPTDMVRFISVTYFLGSRAARNMEPEINTKSE